MPCSPSHTLSLMHSWCCVRQLSRSESRVQSLLERVSLLEGKEGEGTEVITNLNARVATLEAELKETMERGDSERRLLCCTLFLRGRVHAWRW